MAESVSKVIKYFCLCSLSIHSNPCWVSRSVGVALQGCPTHNRQPRDFNDIGEHRYDNTIYHQDV